MLFRLRNLLLGLYLDCCSGPFNMSGLILELFDCWFLLSHGYGCFRSYLLCWLLLILLRLGATFADL